MVRYLLRYYELGWKSFLIALVLQSISVEGITQTTQKVYFGKRITLAPYTQIPKRSLNDCMGYCTLVDHCTAVEFERVLCRLYNGEVTDSDMVDGKGSNVALKADFKIKKADFCESRDCITPIECGPIKPEPGTTVLGNQVFIGARLKFVSHETGHVTDVVCANGRWSKLTAGSATTTAPPTTTTTESPTTTTESPSTSIEMPTTTAPPTKTLTTESPTTTTATPPTTLTTESPPITTVTPTTTLTTETPTTETTTIESPTTTTATPTTTLTTESPTTETTTIESPPTTTATPTTTLTTESPTTETTTIESPTTTTATPTTTLTTESPTTETTTIESPPTTTATSTITITTDSPTTTTTTTTELSTTTTGSPNTANAKGVPLIQIEVPFDDAETGQVRVKFGCNYTLGPTPGIGKYPVGSVMMIAIFNLNTTMDQSFPPFNMSAEENTTTSSLVHSVNNTEILTNNVGSWIFSVTYSYHESTLLRGYCTATYTEIMVHDANQEPADAI